MGFLDRAVVSPGKPLEASVEIRPEQAKYMQYLINGGASAARMIRGHHNTMSAPIEQMKP
jgi:hypothetical protein